MSKHKLTSDRPLINQKIRAARKLRGLSQRDAAEKMGMLYDTYSKKERSGKITTEWILKFCAAIDIPPAFFADVFAIEPEPKSTFVFRAPDPFDEDFFKSTKNVEAPKTKSQGNKKTVTVELTHTENSLINIYQGLSKSQQKEVMDFINSIK